MRGSDLRDCWQTSCARYTVVEGAPRRCGSKKGRSNGDRSIICVSFERKKRPSVDDSIMARSQLPIFAPNRSLSAAPGPAQLIIDRQHFQQIVLDGILKAKTSIDVMTADFKAMLVPDVCNRRRAPSIVEHFRRLAKGGVEIRLLHAGTPSSA